MSGISSRKRPCAATSADSIDRLRLLSVVGTGTEVGKTIVTAGLARSFVRAGYDIGVFKPFASDPAVRPSGEGFSTDADLLARAAGWDGNTAAACGQLFTAPLAPLASARAEGRRVDIALALRQARTMAAGHDLTLVEGCGGWEVPLTDRKTTADFLESLGAPVVIVAHTGLGTINHALLTLESVRRRGLRVLAIILNRTSGGPFSLAEETNAPILRQFARVPVLGPVPHVEALAGKTGDKVGVTLLPNLDSIAREILKKLKMPKKKSAL